MDRLSSSDIRRFAHEARVTSFSVREVGDPELHQMILQAISARRLGWKVAGLGHPGPKVREP